jgi:LysR family transcriptional regulator, transcriptional activator of nhaA
MVNYKHLHYFWTVAKIGSIAKASEELHITPQTISGQLSLLDDYYGVELFKKVGRNLALSPTGEQVFSYAEDIFSLGNELEQMMQDAPNIRPQLFKVGVVDAVSKSIAHQILLPALKMPNAIKMLCREADINTLLAELALHQIDLVVADRSIPSTVNTRGYSHKLGQSSISFFASEKIGTNLSKDFPACLNGAPILLPSSGSQLRYSIDQWLNKNYIRPRIIAEFDDSALMKAFGQEGVGIFTAPTAIKEKVMKQYEVSYIGQADDILEDFYAITVEKKVKNPFVSEVIETANRVLFS